MGDQGSSSGTLRSPQAILENGGCKYNGNVYENGQDFHPILASHGEQKCVKCTCKVRIDYQLDMNLLWMFEKSILLKILKGSPIETSSYGFYMAS